MAKSKSLKDTVKGWFGGTEIPGTEGKTETGTTNYIQSRFIYSNGQTIPITDQAFVKATQPFGTKIPTKIKDRASGWSQMANVSHKFTMEKVQAAFRSAETGDWTLLNAYYRDFFMGSSITAAALTKRKLSTISVEPTILPYDKTNENDKRNAEVIKEIISRYPEFNAAISHMMNSVVYPVSVLEKTFEPVGDSFGENKYGIKYKIKNLYPVDYQLINYRLAYLPRGPINLGTSVSLPNIPPSIWGRPEDTIWDPDNWEPNVRFWSVLPNGLIDYSYANMMAPDPNRHLMYRSNLLNGIARENFGALGKSLLFLTIMSQLGIDKYLRCLQKFGMPFVKLQVDSAQVDTIDDIISTFTDLSSVLDVIAYNKDAIVELEEMNYSGAGEAHLKFIDHIKDCINTLVLGQTLSGDSKSTGLGSGVADLQGDVRQDYIHFDRQCLNECLRNYLFRQLLDINGFTTGNAPKITWGGGVSTEDVVKLSTAIKNLSDAGYILSDDSIEELGNRFGFTFSVMNNTTEMPTVNTSDSKPEELPKEGTREDVIKQKIIQTAGGPTKRNNF